MLRKPVLTAARSVLLLVLAMSLLAGCADAGPAVLRLATTTSTADSGLLEAILPAFEQAFNARVDVVAVGTGQAIALGESGDVDVILVHARAREQAFVAQGHGLARYEVMYNDFLIVGPAADPARVRGQATAARAFSAIAASRSPFASRGDDSGTHIKEMSIWDAAGLTPSSDQSWYLSLGQGMGETLQFAHERGAYALADRGTYLAQRHALPGLTILFGGESIAENPDVALQNPYGVIPVNPARHAGVRAELALQFVEWLTSERAQQAIGAYGVERFGQPLFYPAADTSRRSHP